MRCVKCGAKAVINMRQHKLALCKDHFLEWIPEQTQRFIDKYRMFSQQERSWWPFRGVRICFHSGNTGAPGLSGRWAVYRPGDRWRDWLLERVRAALCEKFAAERGLHLKIVDIQNEYGETIPELASRTHRGQEKPCSVCGLAKRHVMNRVARQDGYDVLVTGHNLDDETAALLGNTLNWLPGYLAARRLCWTPAGAGAKSQAAVPDLRARDGSLCLAARHRIHL